jgi:serine/threonine protein kinase
MEKISHYILHETIRKSRNSVTYRGHKENEVQPVIIKLLRTIDATPSEIAQFRQEYEFIKNLDVQGVIKTIDIIHDEGGFALVMEDFAGIPLKDYFDGERPVKGLDWQIIHTARNHHQAGQAQSC